MKAGLYVIPGYDRDDVGQEIRLTCVRALEKYDASKNNSTPFHFLARCVDNRLRNLLRDNGATLAKNKKEDSKAIDRVEKKRKLQSAISVRDDVPEEALGGECAFRVPIELIEAVSKELSSELKYSFFILIKSGPPAIPKKHLKVIKKTIRELYPGFI